MVAVQMLAELEEVHNIIEYTWSKYLATLVFNMDVVGDRVQAAAGEAARHPGDVVAAAAGLPEAGRGLAEDHERPLTRHLAADRPAHLAQVLLALQGSDSTENKLA